MCFSLIRRMVSSLSCVAWSMEATPASRGIERAAARPWHARRRGVAEAGMRLPAHGGGAVSWRLGVLVAACAALPSIMRSGPVS